MAVREAVGFVEPRPEDHVHHNELSVVPLLQLQLSQGFRSPSRRWWPSTTGSRNTPGARDSSSTSKVPWKRRACTAGWSGPRQCASWTSPLDLLPELLAGHQGPRLVARAGEATVEGPQAVLVSNNVYGMGDIAGLGRRARLDRATLGVFAVTVASAIQAAGLLAGTRSRGLTRLAGPEVVVDADASQIPAGVDGEALLLGTPVRCIIHPAALRVRFPATAPVCRTPNRSWTTGGFDRSP
jgi:hypothetical protein